MDSAASILIIDDSADDRELCRRALSQVSGEPPEFAEAASGERGLEAMAKQLPSCVLLDYSLPKYNGIEILKRLREQYPYIPVVMMTGQGNEAVAVEAMQQGAQNYISKMSITAETLENVIRAAVEHCALEKRIQEQREALEIFTRALAHDLKEPVRTIRSYVDLMERHKKTPEKAEGYFQHVREAADRMAMLIDTVFTYVQLDNAELMRREHCDMNQSLSEAKQNLDSLIREQGARITHDPLLELTASRTQMMQVLQNLIANAIRHSEKPVSVHVHAEEQGGHCLFSVRDDGPGIDAEYAEKIFTPFKRLAAKKENGAGLGLAICRKIIDMHGGKIWCESKPGEGATFCFTLPKQMEKPEALRTMPSGEVRQASNVSRAGQKLANILLVDDRKSDIELTRIMLNDAGLKCNLLFAADSEEALRTLRTEIETGGTVDLMLLDINMPGMDGFELLERLRKDDRLKQTAVVMCTGSTYDKDKARAEALGAIGYLVKPPWFEKLKPILEQAPGIRLVEEGGVYQLLRAG